MTRSTSVARTRTSGATAPPGGVRPVGRGVPKGRVVLLLGGGFGLLTGLWTGLSRAGLPLAGGPAAHHGILMTLGFLGTLISLERAVAYRARWTYLAPALSGCAVLWLLADGPAAGSGVLFTTAGLLVVTVYARTWSTHREPYLALMGAGGLAWVLAALLWTAGASPVRLAPLLGAFLVFTIIGERLELSRLRRASRAATRRLLLAVGVFGLGVTVGWFAHDLGLIVAGIGLLATTGWFVRHDIARITVRQAGLPRFAAVCMLAGYVWLALGGALWITLGLRLGGPLIHDAAVHAVFLGFVLSMVMGHAPIILPAVLRIRLPHRPLAWLPLALLHTTVAARVVADLAGSVWGRGLTAAGNAAALLLFVALTAVTAAKTRPTDRETTRAATPPMGHLP